MSNLSNPDDASADQQAQPSAPTKPRPRWKRRIVLGTIAAVAAGLVGWDIYARVTDDGGPGQVAHDTAATTGTATTPDRGAASATVSKRDLDLAVKYETLSSTVNGRKWCPLVIDTTSCMRGADTERGGLSGSVTVHSSVMLPAASNPSAPPTDAISGGSSDFPQTAVVLLDLNGTSSNQANQVVVLIRVSDHKVMAEQLIFAEQAKYSLTQLGTRIRAGQESDAVDWRPGSDDDE